MCVQVGIVEGLVSEYECEARKECYIYGRRRSAEEKRREELREKN